MSSPHPYLLIVVDEHSRFPFVFPCKNLKSSTVTLCLSSLFCMFGFPGCVHSDKGAPFVCQETRSFLAIHGISISTSTPYHPQGNSLCERSNQTIWRTIKLLLHSARLSKDLWETVLPEALHAVRSLVCLSTLNETPNERFLRFPRKAMAGSALYVGRQASGNPLIVLVIGRYNFKGGESVTVSMPAVAGQRLLVGKLCIYDFV